MDNIDFKCRINRKSNGWNVGNRCYYISDNIIINWGFIRKKLNPRLNSKSNPILFINLFH